MVANLHRVTGFEVGHPVFNTVIHLVLKVNIILVVCPERPALAASTTKPRRQL